MTKTILKAKDLALSFGATKALRGASITVEAGEIVAIMGQSGSGKSTLLHCLAAILKPDKGEVWFDDQRIDTLSDAERTKLRRTKFGFMFQSGQLVPELTTLDNVALPLLLNGISRRQAYLEAQAWLSRLDLHNIEHRQIGELSGGQAQRIALARALIIKPHILFADEPTGALDSLNGEKVMNLLVDLAKQHHVTMIIVTHDARIAAHADREVVVRDGVVQATMPAAGAVR